MKKIMVIIFIISIVSCIPSEPVGMFTVTAPTEIMLPEDAFTLTVSTSDELISGADLYLFKEGQQIGNPIATAVALPAVNVAVEVEWTVPETSFSKNYRIRAYQTGDDPSTSEDYGRSPAFTIGIDPTKFLIELVSDSTYGENTLGFGMWMTTNTDIITGTSPNIVFDDDLLDVASNNVIIGERDSQTGEFLDQLAFGSDVGREFMDAGVYDWSPTLVYAHPDNPLGTMYLYQFEPYAIDEMNDYNFQTGLYYRCTISAVANPNEDPADPTDDYIPQLSFEIVP
jgi:hypothetical protein